jgi:cellulose 1,4-beta-cellobiosidase
VNPDWSSNVKAAAAATTDKALAAKMTAIAGTPTGVWLDKIAAINGANGAMGLRAHLDAALAQSTATNQTVVVTIVIYDLPNRDCSSAASAGELTIAADGLHKYELQFIHPIASILGDPKYTTLRVAAVLEPDSIPNLVTNVGVGQARCDEAASSKAYEQGIQYAINQLHAIPNVYLYADIGQPAWLGWDLAGGPGGSIALSTYYNILSNTDAGVQSVDGIVSNVSNYVPVVEPFLPDPNLYLGDSSWSGVTGGPVKSVAFYSWNSYLDNTKYVADFHDGLVALGFPASLSILIDTGRSGWGGPLRPTALTPPPVPPSAIDPVTYVNENKVDQRAARSQWCNQAGAGIGERPTASPSATVAAYVWVKPPGEADGTSDASVLSNPSLADPMCSTDKGGLPGAPAAGQWFESQFEQLVANAYPPIN